MANHGVKNVVCVEDIIESVIDFNYLYEWFYNWLDRIKMPNNKFHQAFKKLCKVPKVLL
jgi:hypothetical protein